MSTTTPRRESVVGKVQNIASQVTEAVKSGVTHTEQYEGVQEEGLRMLMFGKPGSGKVSLLPFVWRNARSVLWSVG
jgi:tRNA U34 5-carboxymethylaminomethyl modifying GTPase MnmE/TrmE